MGSGLWGAGQSSQLGSHGVVLDDTGQVQGVLGEIVLHSEISTGSTFSKEWRFKSLCVCVCEGFVCLYLDDYQERAAFSKGKDGETLGKINSHIY